MNYRTLQDPHALNFQWRSVAGVRQYMYFGDTRWQPYHADATRQQAGMFLPTPERIAVWADLALNPTE